MEWREIKKKIQILKQNYFLTFYLTGCFVSFKNERGKTRDFTITYSSEDGNYRANFSRLYGTHGWCSSSVSRLPQYLQADFGQIVTVTGVATQGDARRDNWVTSYLIHYGYDGKTWISYGGGQVNLQNGVFSFIFRDLKLVSETSYAFVLNHLKSTGKFKRNIYVNEFAFSSNI